MFRIRSSVLILTILSTTWVTARPSNTPEAFTFGTSPGQDLFSCDAKGPLWCGGVAGTNSGILKLVSETGVTGMALLNAPIALHNDVKNQSVSFETSFQFSNVPKSSFGPGDGLTFVFLNVSQFPDTGAAKGSLYPGAPGPGFGLYDDLGYQVVSTLAVEFDTFQNVEDISNNHVGVDQETRISKIARNASDVDIKLASLDQNVHAWITYDSSAHILEVRISSNNSKPDEPFIQFVVSLPQIFGPEVYIGFAASNGYTGIFSSCSINEWAFETFFSQTPEVQTLRSMVPVIAGLAAGTAALFVLSVLFLFFVWKRKHIAEQKKQNSPILEHALDPDELVALGASLRYSYKQLSAATGQFHEDSKLGEGGFGSVYRGVITSTGQEVAVKKVNTEAKQAPRQFLAEVSIISQLRHRNIVRLLGWCSERNKFLLVYEYMRNRSLDKALFQPAGSVLPWKLRLRIISGAAEGLHYLHQGWRQQVIHRDIKSSNIMLDEEFNAMLGDFGLARMVNRQESAVNTMVAGTFGYIAPEVDGKFTTKTDVYAFGAVALEVACGRSAFNHRLPEEEMLLVDWVWKNYEESTLFSVVDERLNGQFVPHEVEKLLLVGLLSSHPDPGQRPPMRQVLEILAGTVAMPPVPLSKPSMNHKKGSENSTLSSIPSSRATEMGNVQLFHSGSGSSQSTF